MSISKKLCRKEGRENWKFIEYDPSGEPQMLKFSGQDPTIRSVDDRRSSEFSQYPLWLPGIVIGRVLQGRRAAK